MEDYNLNNSTEDKFGKNINYLVPIIILTISVVIAGIIVISKIKNNNNLNNSVLETSQLDFEPGVPENVKSVNSKDHILGNPNAPVKIIEFSDFECPFCKVLQFTMWEVMSTYGKEGKVSWVYRHLPIDSIHTKARTEAVAAECAGGIGGNQSFWDYADRIFEITPSNDNLEAGLLPEIAEYIGIDRSKFEECLQSGLYNEHIEGDFRDAINSGANGTPYTIVIAPNGKTFPVSGSQTYSTMVAIIELALKNK